MTFQRLFGVFVFALAWPLSVEASPVIGDWSGYYDCAQGKTSLDLEITYLDQRNVQALFYFHALPSNPYVPNGCFLMTGQFSETDGILSLQPTRWLLQPSGYVWVSLSGKLVTPNSLTGTIFGPGCSDFVVTRALPDAVRPAPCKEELLLT